MIQLNELSDPQKIKLVGFDSKHREIPITVPPVWTNANAGAVDLLLDPSELSGELRWLDGGTSQIQATVEVKPGKVLSAIPLEVLCDPPEIQSIEIQPV